MAPTALSLAQAHMAQQVKDAAAVQIGLGIAFDRALSPAALDATFPTYLRSALALVSTGRRRAYSTALSYYGEAKRGAGFSATLPAIQQPQLDLFEATQALLLNGPVSVKKQLASGVGLSEALRTAKGQTLRAGKRLTLGSARESLITLSKKDEDALGWARVSDGQPCHFCAMLVSRGPVYKEQTAHFEAHNGCGCSVRVFFKGEADGGWSPDAKALRELWDSPEAAKLGWRALYDMAVNDPSSDVFRTFTNKVASQISAPAIVAARKAAQEAYDAQRRLQKAAEVKVDDAATLAAREAAELEAKKAAEQAAKIKKWQGKPAPIKPVQPVPASTLGPAAFDPWLAAVKARYTAFAISKGQAKTNLEQSLNWGHVQNVINKHDKGALDALKSMSYIDEALYQDALAAMKLADAPIPGAAEAYKRELRSYKNRMTRYTRYLDEWREVNGITVSAKGMDVGRRFTSNSEAVTWANNALHTATGDARSAIRQYTGSSYHEWNSALRKAASKDTPNGRWAELTRQADSGFKPAPEDFIVHRGTQWDEFANTDGKRAAYIPPPPPEELIGTVQVQHGYTSTSVGVNSAFSSNPVQMKILVPEGHRVSWAEPYSSFQGERELLMERSTSYFIHDVYRGRDGQWIVEAEIIPSDIDPALFIGTPPMPSTEKW